MEQKEQEQLKVLYSRLFDKVVAFHNMNDTALKYNDMADTYREQANEEYAAAMSYAAEIKEIEERNGIDGLYKSVLK